MKPSVLILLSGLSFLSYGHSRPEINSLIQQALNKQPPLCLGEIEWPQSARQNDSAWVYANMEALSDAGLIILKKTSRKGEWVLTKMGEKEFKQHGDFCYGQMRINKISEVTHNKDGGMSVIFDYRIDNLPQWATTPAIRSAYSSLDNLVTGIKNARYQADFVLNKAGTLTISGEPYQLDLFY